jgi:uncharacterized protein
MDCTYCYLLERHLSHQMAPATAEAIASSIPPNWTSPGPLEVIWHGGEPLAVGSACFAQLLAPFEPLRRDGRVRHKVQTGATLISDTWCDLFERFDVGVGVSIDGPRDLNRYRVDRGGHAMFDRIVAGVDVLRRRGIPFTVLAVIPPTTTTYAAELFDFFDSLGCSWVGANMEALEAANARDGQTPSLEHARRFWREGSGARRSPGHWITRTCMCVIWKGC